MDANGTDPDSYYMKETATDVWTHVEATYGNGDTTAATANSMQSTSMTTMIVNDEKDPNKKRCLCCNKLIVVKHVIRHLKTEKHRLRLKEMKSLQKGNSKTGAQMDANGTDADSDSVFENTMNSVSTSAEDNDGNGETTAEENTMQPTSCYKYACRICGRRFFTSGARRKHEMNIHDSPLIFKLSRHPVPMIVSHEKDPNKKKCLCCNMLLLANNITNHLKTEKHRLRLEEMNSLQKGNGQTETQMESNGTDPDTNSMQDNTTSVEANDDNAVKTSSETTAEENNMQAASSTRLACRVCNSGYATQYGLLRHKCSRHPDPMIVNDEKDPNKKRCLCCNKLIVVKHVIKHLKTDFHKLKLEQMNSLQKENSLEEAQMDANNADSASMMEKTTLAEANDGNGEATAATNSTLRFKYACRICGRGYLTVIGQRRHERTHPKSKFEFQCEVDGCNSGYATKYGLSLHTFSRHPVPMIVGDEDPTKKRCLCCNKLIDVHSVSKHLKTEKHRLRLEEMNSLRKDNCQTEAPMESNGTDPDSSSMQENKTSEKQICMPASDANDGNREAKEAAKSVQATSSTRFACRVCGRLYFTKEGHRRHERTHPKSEFKFICEVDGCNSGYATQYGLLLHKCSRHPDPMIVSDANDLTKKKCLCCKKLIAVQHVGKHLKTKRHQLRLNAMNSLHKENSQSGTTIDANDVDPDTTSMMEKTTTDVRTIIDEDNVGNGETTAPANNMQSLENENSHAEAQMDTNNADPDSDSMQDNMTTGAHTSAEDNDGNDEACGRSFYASGESHNLESGMQSARVAVLKQQRTRNVEDTEKRKADHDETCEKSNVKAVDADDCVLKEKHNVEESGSNGHWTTTPDYQIKKHGKKQIGLPPKKSIEYVTRTKNAVAQACGRRTTCSKCMNSFGRFREFKMHYHKCNGKITGEGMNRKRNTCVVCGSIFLTYVDMIMHKKEHIGKTVQIKKLGGSVVCKCSGFNCIGIPRDTFNGTYRSKNGRHLAVSESKCRLWKCFCCSFAFDRIENLRLHLRSHHRNDLLSSLSSRNYICPLCTLSFDSVKLLHEHIHKDHNTGFVSVPSPNYSCIQCSKKFKDECAYLTHVENEHPEEYDEVKYVDEF